MPLALQLLHCGEKVDGPSDFSGLPDSSSESDQIERTFGLFAQ
jgi:hypothetical protein